MDDYSLTPIPFANRPTKPATAQERPASRPPPRRASAPPPAQPSRHGAFLLLLMVAAGVLRFAFLADAPLSSDEQRLLSTTSGSFQDLVLTLHNAQRPPLLHELYWVIARRLELTPLRLRIVPAAAGMLMVPAMYFLARQLVGRNAALLSAALAAFSAFLLPHSRHADPFMMLWLAVALSVGSLLWWLRTGRAVALLVWILTSLAMVGLHPAGLIVLTLSPLFLLTRRLSLEQPILMLVALLVILAAPAGYYLEFNRWPERVEELNHRVLALPRVDPNATWRPTFDELMLQSTTRYLFGWDRWTDDIPADLMGPLALRAAKVTSLALLALAGVGVLPWRTFGRWRRRVAHTHEPAPAVRSPAAHPPVPHLWWRSALWTAAWIILPAYTMYCLSTAAPASPGQTLVAMLLHDPATMESAGHIDWSNLRAELAPALTPRNVRWPIVIPLVLAALTGLLACAPTWGQRWRKAVALLVVLLLLLLLSAGIYAVTRNLATRDVWSVLLLGVTWPALSVAAAALLLRLPTPPLRIAAVVALLTINLAIAGARLVNQIRPTPAVPSHPHHSEKSTEPTQLI